MAQRFGASALLVLLGAAGACSSDSEGTPTPAPDAGNPDAGGGSSGSGGSAGTNGASGTGTGGGGTAGSAGASGSAGSGGSAGSAGASDGGGRGGTGGGQDAGSCRASSACGSGQRCCVTMSIANNALESASSTCTDTCSPRAGSTGSGARITSVSCSAASDCAGVRNEVGVAYSECCSIQGFSTGVCVSETHAFSTFEPAGGTCL